jgi:hypothetical protein
VCLWQTFNFATDQEGVFEITNILSFILFLKVFIGSHFVHCRIIFMDLEEARNIREKYLKVVLGKTLVPGEDLGATDILIDKTLNGYTLRVVHKNPDPDEDPNLYHMLLKLFLTKHEIPFNESDFN